MPVLRHGVLLFHRPSLVRPMWLEKPTIRGVIMTTTRREKTVLAGLATIAAVGAMLLASPDAHADTQSNAAYLCSQLDIDSSPASFYAEVSDMLASGLTKDQAADVLTYAMTTECPRYRDEFEIALHQAEKKTPLLRAV